MKRGRAARPSSCCRLASGSASFQGRTDAIGQTGPPPRRALHGCRRHARWRSKASPSPTVWMPLSGAGQGLNYMVVARLRDGVTFEQAEAELSALGSAPFSMLRPNAAVKAKPGVDAPAGRTRVRRSAADRHARLGCRRVLVIACVNIAALLIARGDSRGEEVATRMALGVAASRWCVS